MNGHEAVISEVKARGEDAIEVGEETKKVDLTGPPAGVPGLLPGCVDTASEATRLSQHWEDQLRTLGKEVASFGDRMVLAAETYEADESAAEDDFRNRGPR